jgi:hypothetical protein
VTFWLDGDEYGLAVVSRSPPFASCPAIALSRAIRIRTTEPIGIDQINLLGADE